MSLKISRKGEEKTNQSLGEEGAYVVFANRTYLLPFIIPFIPACPSACLLFVNAKPLLLSYFKKIPRDLLTIQRFAFQEAANRRLRVAVVVVTKGRIC
jgi:hypothetical protein